MNDDSLMKIEERLRRANSMFLHPPPDIDIKVIKQIGDYSLGTELGCGAIQSFIDFIFGLLHLTIYFTMELGKYQIPVPYEFFLNEKKEASAFNKKNIFF